MENLLLFQRQIANFRQRTKNNGRFSGCYGKGTVLARINGRFSGYSFAAERLGGARGVLYPTQLASGTPGTEKRNVCRIKRNKYFQIEIKKHLNFPFHMVH
ncbi:MAG: hypothetical protein J7639_11440 [Paenibacillaceae bacterium]|nr:hypothetical protein [Paenibacillaceae bacterium]